MQNTGDCEGNVIATAKILVDAGMWSTRLWWIVCHPWWLKLIIQIDYAVMNSLDYWSQYVEWPVSLILMNKCTCREYSFQNAVLKLNFTAKMLIMMERYFQFEKWSVCLGNNEKSKRLGPLRNRLNQTRLKISLAHFHDYSQSHNIISSKLNINTN